MGRFFHFVIAALILAILANGVSAAKPPKYIKVVEVEGQTFKVRWRGDEGVVTRQAVLYNADAAHFRNARRAAEIATGCKVSEAYPIVGDLNVILDCGATSEHKPQKL